MIAYDDNEYAVRQGEMKEAQMKIARRYSYIFLLPGLVLLIIMCCTVLTSTFLVVRQEYSSHNSTMNNTTHPHEQGFSTYTKEWQALIISSATLGGYFIFYLALIIAGITIAPESANLEYSTDAFRPTKEFLMKYLMVILCIPFIFVIALIAVILIALILVAAKDAKCDCDCKCNGCGNCNSCGTCNVGACDIGRCDCDCGPCFWCCLWNRPYYGSYHRNTCAEDCVYMCYWCMFWESYNTRYRYAERQVIHTPPVQPQMKKEEEEAALQYPVDPTNPNQNQTVGTTSPYYSQYQLTEEQQLNGVKMI